MTEYRIENSIRQRRCYNCGSRILSRERYLLEQYESFGHSNYRNWCRNCGVVELRKLGQNAERMIKELIEG